MVSSQGLAGAGFRPGAALRKWRPSGRLCHIEIPVKTLIDTATIQMPIPSEFITFVLGAGSSYEARMPTGNELKGHIASSLAFKVDDFRRMAGGDDQIRESLYALGQRPGSTHLVNDYYQAARRICAAMTQAPSIDNFIDSHRSDPAIAAVGKLAIASAILTAERNSTLYVSPDNIYNTVNFQRLADTWFNAFFQLVCLNAQEDDLPGRLSRVRIVTFNYDRTLEHFLYHSIQNYYGTKPERAAEILSHLSIFHPYGKVGALPWQSAGTAVPFGGGISSSTLTQVAETLRTFTEGTSETESQIEQIRNSVFEAETLVFLGFAFHELNLRLLFGSLREVPVRHSKQVFGTAMGLSESNKKAIAADLAVLGRFDSTQITLRRELSASQLLPEYSRSLRVPNAA